MSAAACTSSGSGILSEDEHRIPSCEAHVYGGMLNDVQLPDNTMQMTSWMLYSTCSGLLQGHTHCFPAASFACHACIL